MTEFPGNPCNQVTDHLGACARVRKESPKSTGLWTSMRVFLVIIMVRCLFTGIFSPLAVGLSVCREVCLSIYYMVDIVEQL